MKEIQLTKGYIALVDDEDYDRVIVAGPWHADVRTYTVYAAHTNQRGTKPPITLLHRFIARVDDPKILVDHRDHNGLNCCHHNMRTASALQNQHNRIKKLNSVGKFKGTNFNSVSGMWLSRIIVNGITKYLGRFIYEADAALAYDAAARQYFGEFALTNFE